MLPSMIKLLKTKFEAITMDTLIKLFAIKIVARSFLGSLSNVRTRLFAFLFWSSSSNRCLLLILNIATSDPESKADKTTKIKTQKMESPSSKLIGWKICEKDSRKLLGEGSKLICFVKLKVKMEDHLNHLVQKNLRFG